MTSLTWVRPALLNSMAQRVHTAAIGGESLFVSVLTNQRSEVAREHRVAVRIQCVLSKCTGSKKKKKKTMQGTERQ